MIDISLLVGSTYYEVITLVDGSQKVVYNLPYIANSILTILFFIGIFIIVSNFQKAMQGRWHK